jgi:DNA-binding NtrC family response regulator
LQAPNHFREHGFDVAERLREIVGETTELIEKLAIQAALKLTQDNRATAAEILGLSRQSLYSKLHRHGRGNLSDNS